MRLVYDVEDKPQFRQLVVFAFQQVLAIMAATIAVPMIVGNGMSTGAALFGAGIGTIVYTLFTQRKSPVFLGSSFAFIGSMSAAFAGAVSANAGFAGLILGALFAGLVYVVFALVINRVGVEWVNKLMPPVVIGPTVAIIGLSLAGNAVGDLQTSSATGEATQWAVLCGLVALFTTMLVSTYGKKSFRLIPFIIGILAGYAVALALTLIGNATGNASMQIVSFASFAALTEGGVSLKTFFALPDFTFVKGLAGFSEIDGGYIGTIASAYIPVALVVFAEHIADHKNISSIPSCVMGGVCMALYGFIAVSGLKMIQRLDLDVNKNLYVVSTILISGIGGLSLTFGRITVTSVACSLILGIIVNNLLKKDPNRLPQHYDD